MASDIVVTAKNMSSMPYSRLGYTAKERNEMIKTGYASDFKKNNPRPANSGTVILITRGRPISMARL